MKFPKISLPRIGKGKGSPGRPEGQELKRKQIATVSKEAEGVIKIGKTSYAVSLARTLNREGITIKNQSLDLPKVVGVDSYDLYMQPSGGRITFGSSALGHKKGHTPLAESLDSQILGETWVVAFRVDKRYWWVCSSLNGTINDDTLVKDEARAKDMVQTNLRNIQDIKIFASPDLGIYNAQDAEIWDLIYGKPAPLRKIGFLKNNASRITVVLVTTTVVGGMLIFYQHRMEALRQQEIAMQEAAARRVTILMEDYPWYSGYRVADFLKNCAGAFDKAHMMVIGWQPRPLSCTYDPKTKKISVNAGYDREPLGRIGDLRAAYQGAPGNVSLDPAGSSAMYSEIWDASLTPEYFKVSPWDSAIIHSTILERFQNLDLAISLTSPEMPNVNPATIDSPVFFNHSAGIVTTGIPFEEVGALGDVPAMVPKDLVWNPAIDQWGLTFDIYHPPILPANAAGAIPQAGTGG